MGTIGKAGWVFAVVLLLVCGYLLVERGGARVAEAPSEVASSEDDAASAELAVAREEVVQLKKELAHAQGELATSEAALAEAEAEQKTAKAMAADADDAGEESDEEAAEEGGEGGDDEEGEGEVSRGDRIANAQMAMMGEMMYKPLFDELGLAPEMRDYMKDVIGGHMAEVQQIAAGAMGSKDQKAKDVQARIEAAELALRAELAGTLTAAELEAWDTYEPVADQMLYERLVDGQLNMMAAGLTEEIRVLTSQVVAEELVREFDAFTASEELYTLDNYNNAQARALQTSLERLTGAIPEDQYVLVNGYVDQAIQMFNAMSEQPSAP